MERHIIFDLGQVIVQVDLPSFLTRFSREFHVDASELISDERNGAHSDFMMGKLTGEEFHRITCQHFQHFISLEKFKAIWLSMLVGEVAGMSDIVTELHNQQYPLALLSNVDPWHYEYCQQNLPVLQKFGQKFLSYQLKLKKPEPGIFFAVTERLKAKPEQCIFIDDSETNIRAARALHFQTIRFQNAKQLREELSALGIET